MATIKPNRQFAVVCFLLVLLPLLIFWRATFNGFVDYDDGDYVTGNKQVQAGLTATGIKWAFTTGHASNWHPLTWISHMLDCQLFGMQTGGHHFTSVLLHVINGVLLFVLLNKMTGALWRSAFIAGLFALHPLRVESVAWVSERKDVLSTLFWLLTTIFYVRYVEQTRVQNGKAKVNYALALLFFALGLLSKPMLVTLPFALLLLDFWPLWRATGDGWRVAKEEKPKQPVKKAATPPAPIAVEPTIAPTKWSRLILEKVPFLLLAITSSVITFLVQKEGGAVSNALTFPERIANAVISYCRYLYKLFWPEKLSVLYPHPGHWPTWQITGATIILIAISAVAVMQLKRRPYLFSGWFWFIGTMIPVIGIVQVGIQSMADRYTYVPMIGLTMALTWLFCEWFEKSPDPKLLSKFSSVTVLTACAGLTFKQIGYWKNTETLFSHAVKATKDNYLAYNNLGFYLSNRGRMDEAIKNYRESVKIKPNYEEAHNNLGHALAEKGFHNEAIVEYELALKTKPDLIEAHNNLGNALSEAGRVDDAIREYNYVLERKPDHVDANNNLGVALAMQGKLAEGIKHLEKALKINPNSASAHSNLGNAYAVQQKNDEAIMHYRAALALNPDDAKTHNNLGNVLVAQGKLDDAVDHYRTALKLQAENPEAHLNLGIALSRLGKRDEALQQMSEAVRQRPDYVQAQQHLNALLNSK